MDSSPAACVPRDFLLQFFMAEPNLLQIVKGSKTFGPRVIFNDITLAVNEGEHIGLIGPNGAGKTTLLKIIAGLEDLDGGTIIRSKALRIGYLEQESDWNTDETVEECLVRQCTMPLWDLKKNAQPLGLVEGDFSRKLSSLSGGYRMRVKLLSLIGREPNFLMLDEPTNFLDLETVLVVESFLQGYKGAFLLISHDREFLRRVTDHTVEVEAGEVTKFPGQIDDYFEQKALLREQLETAAASQAARRDEVMDFVRRFGAKATKARQAQSRLRALEKMEVIEVKSIPVRAKIPIPPPLKTGKEVLRVERLSCGYGDKAILTGLDLVLERGQHLGIVGVNGAGKSTLLKTLAAAIPALAGQIKEGLNVTKALFSQHSADQLRPEETVFQALSRAAHSEVLRQEVLNLAGALLFGGDAIDKKIRVLSGGEKARVALGQILLSKSTLLLLDEPTNHLDFDTVEALTEALASYEGSLVIVSHDRGFIRRIANKILEVDRGKIRVWPGTYDDYVWSLQKGVLAEVLAEESKKSIAPAVAKAAAPEPVHRHQRLKQIESELRKSEKAIPIHEKRLAAVENDRLRINEELVAASGPTAGFLAKELHDKSVEINELEEAILREMENIEALTAERKVLRGD